MNYFIMLSKMIDMYSCGYEPTKEEIQMLLKSLKPGQKLPLLNDLECLEHYPNQLVYENYFDRLLEGYTLKFVMNRFLNETMSDPHLIMNERLFAILEGIDDSIECRGLDLHFKWNCEEGVLLHNYKPNFGKGCGHDDECWPYDCTKSYLYRHETDKCIAIGLKSM